MSHVGKSILFTMLFFAIVFGQDSVNVKINKSIEVNFLIPLSDTISEPSFPYKKIVGISAGRFPDYQKIKSSGIKWLRINIPVPFTSAGKDSINPKFTECIVTLKALKKQGFSIMGVTPLAGMFSFDSAQGKSVWKTRFPEWMGSKEGDSFYVHIQNMTKYMALHTIGLIEVWQVSNEMNIAVFHGNYNNSQRIKFLQASALGLREGNPKSCPGINVALLGDKGVWLVEALYTKATDSPFGYIGVDAYFGSWTQGGIDKWDGLIDTLYHMTGKPVLINEWGYSSLGGIPKIVKNEKGKELSVCEAGAWKTAWKKEHSPEEQAEFIKAQLTYFNNHSKVMGSFFYCWEDHEKCWSCGKQSCPAECGWGLVDTKGNLKPSYHAFKETIASFAQLKKVKVGKKN